MEEFKILSNRERAKVFFREFKPKLTEEDLKFLNDTKDFRYNTLCKEIKGFYLEYHKRVLETKEVVEKEEFKQNFSLQEFKEWLSDYYFNNFYTGKLFGLRGIGINIFTFYLDEVRSVFSSFFKDNKNILDCVLLCRSAFDKVQTDVPIRNMETLLKDASYNTLLFIDKIEFDNNTFEAKRLIRDFIIHARYNNCCLIVPRTSLEVPIDKLALTPVFNKNINIRVK